MDVVLMVVLIVAAGGLFALNEYLRDKGED